MEWAIILKTWHLIFFIEGSLGAAIVPDEFRQETFGGFGFTVAGGYEFVKHLNVRCDLMFGLGEKTENDEYYYFLSYKEKSNAFSIMLTLNAMAY